MYCRLNKLGYVEFPPKSAIIDGGILINCDKNIEWLEANGYEDHDQEWIDAHMPPPPPEPPKEYSKLKIYDQVGDELWEQLLENLTSTQKRRLEYAQNFADDDPEFVAAIDYLRTIFPNVDEILEKARIR